MRKVLLILPLAMFMPLAFGQVDSNSITITASRIIASGQPDQAIFGVQVSSGLATSLDDVIGGLQGSGITVANFNGLFSSIYNIGIGDQQAVPTLNWSFLFAVPFTKTKDTVTMLSALQQSIAKKNNGLTMSFTVQGTQASTQSQQTCSLSDLVADARARAQKVADAGGVSVGSILAMSSASPNTGVGLNQVASLGALTAPAPVPASCSLTVKFALVRF
jgi:hypothetical protein